MRELFLLDPDVVYLNHGSFGRSSSSRGIEVPVLDVAGATVMRVSAQAYNDEPDLDALTEALRAA